MFGSLFAEFQVFVENNRFKLEDSTIHDITYQIPYNKLEFSKTPRGFMAKIKVNLELLADGKVVYTYPFENNIIVTNYEKTVSYKYYSDKISLSSKGREYIARISFSEMATDNTAIWEENLQVLPEEAYLSDLEISTEIVQDTTKFMEKFHRGDQLYHVSANHIFTKSVNSDVYYYYEIYNDAKSSSGDLDLWETVTFTKDGIIYFEDEFYLGKDFGEIVPRQNKIDLSALSEGYYTVRVSLLDKVSGKIDTLQTYVSIKDELPYRERFFPDFSDEVKLVGYFLNPSQKKTLNKLEMHAKKNFVSQFWQKTDPNKSTKINEFISLIKERKDYSDINFTVIIPGWKSDRGRVYVKYGAPDDIMYETTDPSKTDFGARDYEIWKYRQNKNQTYIFLDRSGNGNLRMIYSDNDSSESSLSNWKEFLDNDFEESNLY